MHVYPFGLHKAGENVDSGSRELAGTWSMLTALPSHSQNLTFWKRMSHFGDPPEEASSLLSENRALVYNQNPKPRHFWVAHTFLSGSSTTAVFHYSCCFKPLLAVHAWKLTQVSWVLAMLQFTHPCNYCHFMIFNCNILMLLHLIRKVMILWWDCTSQQSLAI